MLRVGFGDEASGSRSTHPYNARMKTAACNTTTIEQFKTNGFVHCHRLLDPEQVRSWHDPIEHSVRRHNKETRSLMIETPTRKLLQTINLWQRDTAVANIVRNPTLAETAAALLKLTAYACITTKRCLREAGGGHTPWHCDQYYWPLASAKTVAPDTLNSRHG